MAVNRDDLSIKINVESGDAKKELSEINKNLKDLKDESGKSRESIDSLGGSFSKLGSGMIVANQALEIGQKIFSGLQTVMEKTSLKAIKLESGIAKITTLLSPMEAKQLDLNKAILDMSKAYGTGTEEIAASLYEAIDNNAIGAKDAILFLTEAQKLAIATGSQLSTVTEGLGRVISAYGLSAQEAAHANNVLITAAKGGNIGLEELMSVTSALSDVASQAGVSFEEFTFSIAALTNSGVVGTRAANYLSAAIDAIIKPGVEMSSVLKSLGYTSGEALLQTNGLSKSIEMIASKTDGSLNSLSTLFGSIKAGSTVIQLTSGITKQSFDDMFSAINSGANNAAESFEKMSKTTDFQMKVLNARFDAAMTSIGQSINLILLPAVLAIADAFVLLSERFASIDIAGLTSAFLDLAKGVGFVGLTIEGVLAATGVGTLVVGGLATSIGAAATASLAFVAAWAPVIAGIGAAVVALDLLIANFNILIGKQKKFSGGFFGKAFTEGQKLLFGVNEEVTKVAENVDNVAKSTEKAEAPIKKVFGNALTESIQKASEGMKNLIAFNQKYGDELLRVNTIRRSIGASSAQRLGIEKELGYTQLNNLEAQLKKSGELNSKNKEVIAQLSEAKKKVEELARVKAIEPIASAAPDKRLKVSKDIRDLNDKLFEQNIKNNSLMQSMTENIWDQYRITLRKQSAYESLLDSEIKLQEADLDRLINLKAETKEIENQKSIIASTKALRKGQDIQRDVDTQGVIKQIQSERLKTTSGIVSAMSSGADSLVTSVISAVGTMFGPIGELVAQIVNVFRKGYEFMKTLGSEFLKILMNIPTMISDGILGLVDGIIQGITEWLSDPEKIGKNIVALLGTVVPRILASIVRGLAKIVKMIFTVKFWADIIEGAFIAIRDSIADLWRALKNPFEEIKDAVGNGIVNGVQNSLALLTGFGQKLFTVIDDVINGRASTSDTGRGIEDAAKKAEDWWAKFKREFSAFFKQIINDTFELIFALIEMVDNVWLLVRSIPEKIIEALIGIGEALWSGIQALPEFLVNAVKGLGEALWGAISSLGEIVKVIIIDPIVGIGSAIWESIKGIGSSIKSLFTDIFSFGDSQGTVEGWITKAIGTKFDIPVLRFAEGGNVPGNAKVFGDSYKNDNVPALLSPGEYVLPRSITQNKDLFNWIMRTIDTGKPPEMHAFKKPTWVSNAQKTGSSIITDIGEKTGVNQALENLTNSIPPEAKAVYDWVVSNLGAVDIWSFAKNPWGTIKDMLKNGIGGYVEPRIGGMMESIIGNTKFHEGGLVGNYAFGGEVPAMLQSGEFVMNRRAVSNIGESNLGNMNLGRSNPMGDTTINIDLKIDTEQPIDEAFIRSKLIPSLKKELRESSLRGEFVLSQKGLRS